MGNLKFEGKPSVYFEADRATFTVNLRALSEALLEFASEEQIPLRMASSDLNSLRVLESILVSVVEYFQQKGQKFVLLLDEFPRLEPLIKTRPKSPLFRGKGLFLILCLWITTKMRVLLQNKLPSFLGLFLLAHWTPRPVDNVLGFITPVFFRSRKSRIIAST